MRFLAKLEPEVCEIRTQFAVRTSGKDLNFPALFYSLINLSIAFSENCFM